MLNAIRHTFIGAVLASLAASAGAGEIIATFEGSGDRTTRTFEVDGPWLLTWRVSSEYRMQTAFELTLLNGDTGLFESRVLKIRRTANGLKLFEERGKFQFRVNANFADWYLQIEQISEAEKEALERPERPGF
jgi:hypothetical protein